MPRILVDLLFLTGTKGGMESYVRRLYSAMPREAGIRFTALISKEAEELDFGWFPGDIVPSGRSGDDRLSWARGELTSLPGWVRRTRADLVHAPANVGPPRCPVPVVLTVHDLLPFVHPEWVPGRYAPALRWMIRRAASNASRILTVSDASAADIVQRLGVPRDRVVTIPLAGEAPVEPGRRTDRSAGLVMCIGNRMPHKNVETLVRALSLIPAEQRPRLALTGGSPGDEISTLAGRLGVGDHVDVLGWIDEPELESLFGRATMVAIPTLFEGFGLPVLEGMSRGCPVVCSDIPVLRAVGGDAATYVDPRDPTAWAASITRLGAESAEREALSSAGLQRAALFSWESTAVQTLEVFQSAAAAS